MAINTINDGEVDPAKLEIPQYDEEEGELFSGPGFPGYEAYDAEEFFDEDDPELIASVEQPAAHSSGPVPRSAGIESDYTQGCTVPDVQ